MAAMSYLSVIERYHEFEPLVHELLESILTGIGDPQLFHEGQMDLKAVADVAGSYPFVELIYLLDSDGRQVSQNIALVNRKIKLIPQGRNADRSQRPYFLNLEDEAGGYVTRPYLSHATGGLCISASRAIYRQDAQLGILVVDVNLTRLIEFMMGDSARRRVTPLFKGVYATIVLGLFVLVALLLTTALTDIYQLLTTAREHQDPLQPFGIIIFITLALAIFDLGKTILEEEVLMHKDIFRHSSTRRTITRFVATILIAISIEALLTMFKASLGEKQYVEPAIWMMLAVVGLLVGLGAYVYLGAKAEWLLIKTAAYKSSRGSPGSQV
ncbi:PDC sensor domain-containing protein [Shewanella salipaludis]|uniref:General glycosylation pathway protein n=1 Tax=Shewanella salipaludis TaxID=2723052 RepID=A0A972G954_9GAMM|nr:PDC sensor domain-containing protein [Shewanella salipaludis]NMH66840.1 general glycosylation pathway protein [Shewanella salipaludis]